MNGLVLAGGKSTRMLQDKALINYHGTPQYQYVFDMIQPYCQQVFIATNTNRTDIVLPQIVDMPTHRQNGPIAALHAAFNYSITDWLVVAIDYPFINNQEIQHLLAVPNTGQDATIFYNNITSYFEPFIGIYHAAFANILKDAEANNITSMQTILAYNCITKVIPLQHNSLINANTPAELQNILSQLP